MNGGGIYSKGRNYFNLSNFIMKNCRASNNGGGIFFGESDKVNF